MGKLEDLDKLSPEELDKELDKLWEKSKVETEKQIKKSKKKLPKDKSWEPGDLSKDF